MTQREKVLGLGLLAVVTVMGGGVGCYALGLGPYLAARDSLETTEVTLKARQSDLEVEKARNAQVLQIDPRLAEWKKISLPAPPPTRDVPAGLSADARKKFLEARKQEHLKSLSLQYERYLSSVVRKHGFKPESIKIDPGQRHDRRKVPTTGAKVPVYEGVSFIVKGQASLAGVVGALRELHQAPLLHHIKALNLTRAGKGLVDMRMTVEAIQVQGAEQRASLLPEPAPEVHVLASMPRRYDDLTIKHPFDGYFPPKKVVKEEKKEDDVPSPRENSADVLRFVRLTQISYNGRRWDAYIYDLNRDVEQKVNARTLTEFTVKDKYGNDMLDAEVIRLNEEEMIFKAGGKYYRICCGEFFQGAVEAPLSRSALKKLNITPEEPKEEKKDKKEKKDGKDKVEKKRRR
jgi:hypothetical protein